MRFLISVIDDETGTATADEMTAIDAFNEQLQENGHWVTAGGLSAPSAALVLDARGDALAVVDGPLHDAPEYLSGFWLISAADLDAARALAAAASRACHRRVELRPLLG